ncbi:MAG: hypothetical protein JWO30_183 [Fibrobacteres bacterium]|nr:hypothetical protein [Fibrobacterota bacterium]
MEPQRGFKWIAMGLFFAGSGSASAADGRTFDHLDQSTLLNFINSGNPAAAFGEAFETGDELFDHPFNEFDGGGANVGQNWPNGGMIRYTRTPRASLGGPGEWRNHFPSRATGPNAQACEECHNLPVPDGAGGNASNVHRDPLHTGNDFAYIQRNTPHLFAPGALQQLAEELTNSLQSQRQTAINSACAQAVGATVTANLSNKGVSFGSISVKHNSGSGASCNTTVNTASLKGVAADLVVRPFQWKGSVAFLRDFIRGATHNEIGMQTVETVGAGVDGDGDGVVDELSIGDETALAVYMAAQPRPTSSLELNQLGLLTPALTAAQITQINRGATAFTSLGCAACHTPSMTLSNPIYSEPSQMAAFRDQSFPAGQNPLAEGVDPAKAVKFDLTQDQPDNILRNPDGTIKFRLGSLRRNGAGLATVDAFSDLKRHDLGMEVGEPIDEEGTGASVFLTKPLWGVGSTAPYMHNGQFPSLTSAIKAHGGEGTAARTNFNAAPAPTRDDLLAFLNNLVLFRLPE